MEWDGMGRDGRAGEGQKEIEKDVKGWMAG